MYLSTLQILGVLIGILSTLTISVGDDIYTKICGKRPAEVLDGIDENDNTKLIEMEDKD